MNRSTKRSERNKLFIAHNSLLLSMSTWDKVITLMLVVLLLTVVLSITSITHAQITSSYGNHSDINTTAFTLTIYSPNNQTFSSIMPLNFSIDWTEYPTFQLPVPPAPILNAVYNYTIDNNPPVTVTSNQSSSDVFEYGSNFTVNPTFSYLVNVSNFANGFHKIVITATLYGYSGGFLFFGASSSPIQFLVQNSTPTPQPPSAKIAVISPLTVTIISAVIVLVIVIVSLLFYRKHQTSKLK
jgi:hypothetical protein